MTTRENIQTLAKILVCVVVYFGFMVFPLLFNSIT